MIGIWSALLYDKDDGFIAELPFDSLSIVFKLNDVWTANLRVEYSILKDYAEKQGNTVADLISTGFRWVDVRRNGITIFRGILSDGDVEKDDINTVLQLSFKSWLGYFSRRYITKIYTATDQGDIAWDMIDTMQGETDGDIGVTMGTITATKDRDREFENDEVAKNMIAMGNQNILDGYEMEISNTKIFTAKARLGSDKPTIVFDASNIKNHRIAYRLGLGLTNRVTALGEGFGADQLSIVRNAGGAYQTKWKVLHDIDNYSSVKEVATLQDHADAKIALLQDSSFVPEISVVTNNVELTTYDVGDGVTVRIEDVTDALYRIKTKTISVNEGEEVVKLAFL